MQLDMHYYGTFALARAAGLREDAALVIATSAAFTDDATARDSVRFLDGARLDVEATAHHAVDIHNVDLEDQRKVWVPFHFFPSNQGDEYSERLVCRMDSPLAREMVDHNLRQHAQPYYLALMGVTAHVYADTFAHYGFSGVSSRRNRIANDSFRFDDLDPAMRDYISGRAKTFFDRYQAEGGLMENIKSWFAETASGALGHGAAATFPDRPYLVWSFDYEYPDVRRERRDNRETFLAGCKALHGMFRQVAEFRPELASGGGREFEAIEERVRSILAVQALMKGRIEAWQKACSDGDLFGKPEAIPVYDPDNWHAQRDGLDGVGDSREALDKPVYRFYQAAAAHRTYVIRDLLPAHDLVVG